MKNKFYFDPLKHGFEPIVNYPELGFNFPMIDGYYVKIICYDNFGDLVYWYLTLSTHIGFMGDDRIQIMSGSYDFRKPSKYGEQNNPHTRYLGLISDDKFGEALIKHLLGTNKNESLNSDSITRYNERLGVKMRNEYQKHYKI